MPGLESLTCWHDAPATSWPPIVKEAWRKELPTVLQPNQMQCLHVSLLLLASQQRTDILGIATWCNSQMCGPAVVSQMYSPFNGPVRMGMLTLKPSASAGALPAAGCRTS